MPSSPFPKGVDSVALHVSGGSPLAEVFLIDHDFSLVERSVGDLDVKVKPGVYKVKARLGDKTTEQLVVLDKDKDVDVSAQLEIAAPAPLAGTSRTHDYHMGLAQDESETVAERAGKGATIFLLTRRHGTKSTRRRPRLSELTLHAPDGTEIVDVLRAGKRTGGNEDAVAGATIEVDPGAYFLRWCGTTGVAAEQAIVAVAGWQTQVFLLQTVEAKGGREWHDLSVQMSRGHFDPGAKQSKRVEELREALANERKVASLTINKSLLSKFQDPMLGLLGAHLMLIAQEAVEAGAEQDKPAARGKRDAANAEPPEAPVAFNQALFDRVVKNLMRLLGAGHPDVVALATKMKRASPAKLPPVTSPPLLWRSWLLLLDASAEAPALIPTEVWQRTINVLPTRPFLAWSPPEEGEEAMSEEAKRGLTRQRLAPRAAPATAFKAR